MPLINPNIGLENLQLGFVLNPALNSVDYEEWFFTNSGIQQFQDNWTASLSGAGSITGQASTESNHPGILEVRAGTAATGAAIVFATNVLSAFFLPTGRFLTEQMLRLETLSDGVDSYTCRHGIGDNTVSVDISNGVYWEYTHTLNGGNWTACAATGAVRTKVDTGVPADTGWHVFQILSSAGNAACQFIIDGILRATIAANIPNASSAPRLLPGQMLKSAGANTRSLRVDYTHYAYSFGAAR